MGLENSYFTQWDFFSSLSLRHLDFILYMGSLLHLGFTSSLRTLFFTLGSLLHFMLYSSLRALFFTLGSILHFGLSFSLQALFFTYCTPTMDSLLHLGSLLHFEL